jgi:catechol 2,3-dioxygenase-like lactoylglutathione lyase family enzyme
VQVRHVTPILNVSDIEASLAWFAIFGWRARWTWNGDFGAPPPATFAAVHSGDVEIFLCRGAQGSRGERRPQFPGDDETDGVWMSWWLDTPAEVDAAHALALEHGLDVTFPPTDEPWGVREFHLRHPDGHMFRVGSGLDGDVSDNS